MSAAPASKPAGFSCHIGPTVPSSKSSFTWSAPTGGTETLSGRPITTPVRSVPDSVKVAAPGLNAATSKLRVIAPPAGNVSVRLPPVAPAGSATVGFELVTVTLMALLALRPCGMNTPTDVRGSNVYCVTSVTEKPAPGCVSTRALSNSTWATSPAARV